MMYGENLKVDPRPEFDPFKTGKEDVGQPNPTHVSPHLMQVNKFNPLNWMKLGPDPIHFKY